MRRTCCFFISTLCLIAASVSLLQTAQAAASDAEAAPRRGIAVLASSIGSDYSPETLAKLVEQWNFSPVVIDWAWITFHWDRTNFAAVNRFLELMAEENVPVAGMYRPRFLGRPTVSTQTDRQGRPATSHGHEICFSNSQAREWGLSWGSQILRKCPRLNEIIIYNPRNLCQCPACREAAQGRSYAHYDAVWRFLAEAKAAWRKQRAGAKLGVVFVNDLEFWRRGAQVVDVAHPFLFITDSTDMARNTAEASAIRDLLRDKMGSCLAKITWGPEDKVTPGRLAEFDRLTAEAALPYFFWTFDTLFDSSLYDREAVARILSANQWAAAKQSARPTYTPEVRDPQAEAILERMATREPGVQFAALRELIQKVKESDPETQRSIISMVTKTMKDTSRPIYQRWQCCYVISDSGYEPGVPDLIEVLLHDRLELMRSVAAAALSKFPDNEAAHNALLQAARQETSPQVRQELARHLGEEMPAAKPRPAPTAAPALDSAGAGNYSAAEIRNTSAEVFLERIAKPEPGHHQFDALSALTHKAKTSSPAERNRIISLVIRTTQDGNSPMHQRWQCSKILGYIGDEKAVPALIQALLHDESEIVRSVAAEALAKFPDNAAAHEALLQAARQETSERVREALTQHLGEEMPDVGPSAALTVARAVEERAPTGPPQPPPMRKPRISEPLPWPFPGGQEDQHIFNNYQQATDMYIHGALDFIQPAGTPVKAVYPGYVAAIYTNYPDWITHYFFIVTPKKGGSQGWCYTHLDPRTFTFKEGDFISQGQYLGDLVDFSVGDRPGATHLHLHYVKFSRDASGKVEFSSLIDPLYFFDWNDTQPPAFKPLVFVRNNTTQQFQADSEGVITVNGKVDILAAISDSAFSGHYGNLGVPVVMFSISDGTHTMQKLVVDHRGDFGEKMQVEPLYLSHDEQKVFFDSNSFPRYRMMRVTKTDGDGKITPQDARECWDTTAQDDAGRRIWPDGEYAVNVYAWDIADNRAAVGAIVRVNNR